MHAHSHPPLKPPALRRPQATAALSSLQLGVPGGTTLFVKLTLTAVVTVDTPVTLSTDDPTATLPASVLVPAGQSFARFAVQTRLPTARRFLTVRATLAGVTRLVQITLETAAGPTPVPVPVPAAITGYQSAAGTALASAKPGDTILVVGTGFTVPVAPAFGRLIIGDGDARVLTWTDTRITAVVQPVAPGPEPVRLYLQAGVSGAPQPLVMVAAPLTITSGSQVAAVTGFFASDGVTPLTHASPGALFVIRGSGLGTAAGMVAFDPTGPAAIQQWTDTQITGIVPDPQDGPRVHETVQVALPQGTTFLSVATEFTIDGTPTPPRLGTVQRTSAGLLIQGTGFGTPQGTVSAGGVPLGVLTWGPTTITTSAPTGTLGMLTVRRADGQWYSSTPGLLPAARLPGWPR